MKRVYIFAIALVVVVYLPVSATIINIPDDYETIQEGIDASTDGDTVLVQPDTYVENINFNGHNIVLGSLFLTTGDPLYISTTVIDGDGTGSVVTFESGENNTAVTTGFTIQNGYAQYGGGIFCDSSNPTISYNAVSGNLAGGGGGIYCYDNSNPTASNNTISGNSADAGGGIFIQHSSPTLTNNNISENIATGQYGNGGGIILIASSNPTISNNTISGNSAYGGGGISCRSYSNPTISSNTISGNSADHHGGGIYCYNYTDPTISNNTISGNSADYYGGGIYCEMVSNPVIANTIFWADSAPYGAEIDFDDLSSPYITYCDIQGGWAGEGNIDCNPQFCNPSGGNYYLTEGSCCLGGGEGGADIGAFGQGCWSYIAGDVNYNTVPLELTDVMAMIRCYHGAPPYYTCDCPPHGSDFPATADPNGNCVAFELGDVVTEIAAYRGSGTASGCEDCPGQGRLLSGEDTSPVTPSLKAKATKRAPTSQ